MLTPPAPITKDKYQAAIWRTITKNRRLTERDVPNLELLCFWHSIAKQAQENIKKGKKYSIIQEEPTPRKAAAVAVLKEASSEIRALNDTLGISHKFEHTQDTKSKQTSNATLLKAVFNDNKQAKRA